MSTYAENQAARERKVRKASQDAFLRRQTAQLDAETAAGTDKRGNWKGAMKYERPSFTVVTASEAFREGWDRIFEAKDESTELVVERPSLGRQGG